MPIDSDYQTSFEEHPDDCSDGPDYVDVWCIVSLVHSVNIGRFITWKTQSWLSAVTAFYQNKTFTCIASGKFLTFFLKNHLRREFFSPIMVLVWRFYCYKKWQTQTTKNFGHTLARQTVLKLFINSATSALQVSSLEVLVLLVFQKPFKQIKHLA